MRDRPAARELLSGLGSGLWRGAPSALEWKALHNSDQGSRIVFMKKNDLKHQVVEAISACQEKKAEEISILELDQQSGAFTDYFVVCSGSNPRQVQAIADEVQLRLKKVRGLYAHNVEGYKQAEWVLLDYVDFVVHVFSEKARKFYDLERLWKSAKRLLPADLAIREKAKRASTPSVRRKRA
jgi:ribosome-associated protein